MIDTNNAKLFGRYHDIALLLLGFVFTTLVGGYLSNSWQSRAAEIEREAEQKRYEIKAATSIFENVSKLMDKRLYRMRRVSMGIGNEKNSNELNQRWDIYREALFEWNESLNRNLAMVQMYFGEDARLFLEKDIQLGFISYGRMLENSKNNGYKDRLQKADDLNNKIYNFDLWLIGKIQKGQIGSFNVP